MKARNFNINSYIVSLLLISASCTSSGYNAYNVENDSLSPFAIELSDAAIALTKDRVTYDPAYVELDYPGGDVAANRGVCTDVIIRAYRQLGIDLQKNVHEDMKVNFNLYPNNWGLSAPDPNIDHKRVPNLMTYFARHGYELPITSDPKDYKAGHIVAWRLDNNMTHIGILIAKVSSDGRRPLIVHNIGNGQEISDCLFDFRIIGHYYYEGK